MKFLVLILVVMVCGTGGYGSLSHHSNNLVQMFSDYLSDMETRQMNMALHNRKRDGVY